MSSLDIEIRKLDCQALSDLSDILEFNDDWKRLMAIIPTNLEKENCANYKYNGEHFGLIECARKEQTRPCTAILIEEWGTSGKIRPRLSTLRKFLVKAQLFRAADYVSKLLDVPPPERPSTGPAALVSIPSVDELPIVQVVPSPTAIYPEKLRAEFSPVPIPICQHSNSIESQQLPNPAQNSTSQANVSFNFRNIFENSITEVPYKILCDATDNFNETLCLGCGACGTVYLGKSNSGNEQIAVKRLHKEGVPGDPNQQFRNEIMAFSKLNHPNIISLLGFSCGSDSLCLIYPFMENGSLNDMLSTEEKRAYLNWKIRLDITVGVAKGIEYLHNSKIIHRDIKTANILLDNNMQPKIGDFGLVRSNTSTESRSTIVTNTVVGTKPYMSWEAFSGVITDKMDVFSFGVVLLELLTGLPALIEDVGPLVDYIFEKKYECEEFSNDLAFVEDVLDKKAGDWKVNIANDVFKVSLDCLANDKNSRPEMAFVKQRLEIIKESFT